MTKWKVHPKRHHGGKYMYYRDTPCLLVTDSGKSCATGRLYLSPATLELLGKPERVLLLSDGNGSIGLRGVGEKDPQYNEAYALAGRREDYGRYVTANVFIRENGLKPNTVNTEVYIEGEVVVAKTDGFGPARYKA
jgi:hypothetical protein